MPSLVRTETSPSTARILTADAVTFLADLHERFAERRDELLIARSKRQARFDAGELPGFLPETEHIRSSDWHIGPIPAPLKDRRVEITGPVDRKMMINALNSGARVFMADFEDSLSPTWQNIVEGQANVMDAVRGELVFDHPTKGRYEVDDDAAVLVIRPRGWHLEEAHLEFNGKPAIASLVDFGLAFFHNARQQLDNGAGPYFYLPKLEHYNEAKLWDEVFRFAQKHIGLPPGTIKATVLIETLPAVFQMDEILHSLKDHIVGLNAGRWDYIFSCIKTLNTHPDKVLPDRGQVTMTTPPMRAYTELLVRTCHNRGAFAMGGMSAFIPDRRDPERTKQALEQVRADKQREAKDGCDGTWVAHPDLVPVAMEIFDAAIGTRPNQLHRRRQEVDVQASALLDFTMDGQVTLDGIQQNVDVGLRYLTAWLQGNGAAAIHGLMEDAATAEISRSQLWQWVRHGVKLPDGRPVTAELVKGTIASCAEGLAKEAPKAPVSIAEDLLVQVTLSEWFQPFVTTLAYGHLVQDTT